MNESLKVSGYTLNVEYFSEILHCLRDEPDYPTIVDELLYITKDADTRDVTAVKRLTSAYLKLLFPQVKCAQDIDKADFETFCLKPALNMRGIVRRQIRLIDREFKEELPKIRIKRE
jgi:ATP-dependent Lon protease